MVSASRPERTRPASAVMESKRALRSAADVTCERALFRVFTMSTILLSLTCSGNNIIVNLSVQHTFLGPQGATALPAVERSLHV